MIKKLRKYLTPKYNRELEVQAGKEAQFELHLDELLVGKLKYHNGQWEFLYSQQFKEYKGIRPLADFPDIHKTYRSTVLWPFFSSRIPSLARSRVRNVVERESIAPNDVLALLERFGKRTITNPYVLETNSLKSL